MEVTETSVGVGHSEPLCPEQVRNNAGGFGWKVDDFGRLRRFLCLGSEGGSYYTNEKTLGLENAECIDRLLTSGKGTQVVDEIVKYSVEGRTAKQNPIIFALALCARQEKDAKAKKHAYEKLAEVCRIPTHLFHFVEYSESLSRGTGWGRAHRTAVSKWYNQFSKNPRKLAMHVTKYKNRNGWTHTDVLRLAHPKPATEGVAAVVRYIIKGIDLAKEDHLKDDAAEEVKQVFTFLEAVERVKKLEDEKEVRELIGEHGLVREHLPTSILNSKIIWHALLEKMPMTAMLRNLGKMSSIHLLESGSEDASTVCNRLSDEEALKAARVHPFNILVALKTYERGRGIKGSLNWDVNTDISGALNEAFYKSFTNVEPTNLRYCLSLDVSGSMDCGSVNGSPGINPRSAASALVMVTLRTEPTCETLAFCDKLEKISLSKTMDLETVEQITLNLEFGGTDCSLPLRWACEQKKLFDVFVVYTDNDTWCDEIQTAEALRLYRKETGLWNAKLIVVAMTSDGFTIADPDDPGMLDMAGFDSAGPEVMREFALGMI